MDYHRREGVKVKIIRIFNTYGPNMHPQDGRVVSNYIVQALQGKDLTIYGTGRQTRSFQYVTDLIEGMVRMMERTGDDFTGPVNLGNPGEFTMLELAEKILQLTGSRNRKSSLCPFPLTTRPNASPIFPCAKEKLDWKPLVALEDGLRETIAYFRRIL